MSRFALMFAAFIVAAPLPAFADERRRLSLISVSSVSGLMPWSVSARWHSLDP